MCVCVDACHQVLEFELKQLQNSLSDARTASAAQLEDMLSLALNSLQRLHAGQGDQAESDDEDAAPDAGPGGLEGEDDDEDPFFMPMPGAIKWAEASMFKELAKPLAPEQPVDRQFMIVMEDGTSRRSSHVVRPSIGMSYPNAARLAHGRVADRAAYSRCLSAACIDRMCVRVIYVTGPDAGQGLITQGGRVCVSVWLGTSC